jgi:hypothetical protein
MRRGQPERQLPGTAPPTLKNCAACGAGFSCGAPAAGCWCEEVHVTAIVLLALRARYADCLCRRCLMAVAGAALPGQRAPRADSESTRCRILP